MPTALQAQSLVTSPFTMSKSRAATDQIVKLIVGAGQASPSPPVGPALGSKGVKSMDFCKVRANANANILERHICQWRCAAFQPFHFTPANINPRNSTREQPT